MYWKYSIFFTFWSMANEWRAVDYETVPRLAFFVVCKIIISEHGFGHILGLQDICCAQIKISNICWMAVSILCTCQWLYGHLCMNPWCDASYMLNIDFLEKEMTEVDEFNFGFQHTYDIVYFLNINHLNLWTVLKCVVDTGKQIAICPRHIWRFRHDVCLHACVHWPESYRENTDKQLTRNTQKTRCFSKTPQPRGLIET